MSHPSEVRNRVERQVQTVWGSSIAIYLFLGGLGAGAYFVSAIATLLGMNQPVWNQMAATGVAVSWVVVGVGLLVLLSHLGKPMRAAKAASNPGSSWISRGVLFFSGFLVLALIHTFAGLQGGALVAVVVLGMLFALMTMAYTGALLSSSKGLPLWRTSILPVLFLVSGVVTGLALVVLSSVVAGRAGDLGLHQVRMLALGGAVAIVVELLAIMSFMNSAYKSKDGKEAASRIVGSAGFIWGDLILGLTVPLVLLLAAYFGIADKGTALNVVSIASLLILIGGYLLRHSILAAGMSASLETAGFKFRPIANPDFLVSEPGRLPPS